MKQSVYLSTHDGYLFSNSVAHAYPPTPPGPHLEPQDAESLHASEVLRGTSQILTCNGVSDMRAVVAVRRAFHQIPMQSDPRFVATITAQGTNWEDTAEFWADVERTDEDEVDKGGEEGLATTSDKPRLRTRRSIELLLTSGRVVRFEVGNEIASFHPHTHIRFIGSFMRGCS